jgi:hypothetical protein
MAGGRQRPVAKDEGVRAPLDGDAAAPSIPRVGILSRTTIRCAIERLQQLHGLLDPDSGFAALQKASQTHNVKLRSVAAAVLSAETLSKSPRKRPPVLSFSVRGGDAQPNRTHVLHDLLHSATELSEADYGAVQLRDPVHGGLIIEGQQGFGRDFLDFFSYIDDAGTACGTTVAKRSQTFVEDVATSPIYTAQDRDVVLEAGVRSVLSTPLRDDTERVVGAVTTHFSAPRRNPGDAAAAAIQRQADECAQWLTWYEATAMPRIITSVHNAARAAKVGESANRPRSRSAPSPAALRGRRTPAR